MINIGLKILCVVVLFVISVTIANYYEKVDNSKMLIYMSIYLILAIFLARFLGFVI